MVGGGPCLLLAAGVTSLLQVGCPARRVGSWGAGTLSWLCDPHAAREKDAEMGPEPGGEKGPITTTEQTGTFCLLNVFYCT